MKLPSLHEKTFTNEPPPPNKSEPESKDQNNFDDDSEDSGNLSEEIPTCEDQEEVDGGLEEFQQSETKRGESRSMKIFKKIVQPLNDDEDIGKMFREYGEQQKNNIKTDTELQRVYGRNMNIFFEKKSIKSVMESVDQSSDNNNSLRVTKAAVTVMGSICKVYITEIIDECHRIRKETGEHGPIKVEEVAAAVRRMKDNGQLPQVNKDPIFKFQNL